MSWSAALLADGSSDLPLAAHIEWICADLGFEVAVSPLGSELFGGTGRTVRQRLHYLVQNGYGYDLVFVHRDAEAQDPDVRRSEVSAAAQSVALPSPVIPVVPVRMTEAWLLLDEAEVRFVAGKPNGRISLPLPKIHEVERMADPKERLREVLLAASETAGRRRAQFQRDFDRHRSLLIERLDPTGPVTQPPPMGNSSTVVDPVAEPAGCVAAESVYRVSATA